jgi:putative tRNA adenosine deaminase-associated protein
MSYFATALVRGRNGWSGYEMDLDGVIDVDDLADRVRELDDGSGPALLFVEEDDEYVAIVRVDGDAEARVFLSDARAGVNYPTAALIADAVAGATTTDPTDEDAAPALEPEPVGDPALLADLGVPGPDLLGLCAQEGTLPADVITELCERTGCLDELETLRPGV